MMSPSRRAFVVLAFFVAIFQGRLSLQLPRSQSALMVPRGFVALQSERSALPSPMLKMRLVKAECGGLQKAQEADSMDAERPGGGSYGCSARVMDDAWGVLRLRGGERNSTKEGTKRARTYLTGSARNKLFKAKTKLLQAESELDTKENLLQDAQNLHQKARNGDPLGIAEAKHGEAKVKVDVAEAKLDVAKAMLDFAKAELQAAPKSKKAKVEVGVAKAEVGVAEAKVGIAETKLGIAETMLGVANAELQAAPNSKKAKAKIVKAEVGVAEAKVGVAKAQVGVAETKLGIAETKLGIAETMLGVAKAELQAAPNSKKAKAKIAKAEVGVAEAKVGVAKAEVGVAKAEVGVAKAEVGVTQTTGSEQAVNTVWHMVETAVEKERTANMAYEMAVKAMAATPLQGTGSKGSLMQRDRFPRHSPSSRLSWTALGREQCVVLPDRLSSEPSQGKAVLSEEEGKTFSEANLSESALIRRFTPRLNQLVQKASKQVGSPLVLVNSEHVPWVEDPSEYGSPSSPDMFISHPAFFMSRQEPPDSRFVWNDFNFGKCAPWDLRDGVVTCVEWKKAFESDGKRELKIKFKTKAVSALGQAVDYARRIAQIDDNVPLPLDTPMVLTTHWILADKDGFYLVVIKRGNVDSLVPGLWTDAGSEDAIVKFIAAGSAPGRWGPALSRLCAEFNVTLDCYDKDRPCFLGRGVCGRVFRVRKGDDEYALKVAINSSRFSALYQESSSALYQEASNYRYLKVKNQSLEEFAKLGCIASVSNFFISPDREFAGLLSSPVGDKCAMIKENMVSAVMGLKQLALSGFRHGDARLPNVVIHQGKAVWIDLGTLRFVQGDDFDSKVVAFKKDLTTFLISIDEGEYFIKIEPHIRGFMESGDEGHQLIELLTDLWPNSLR